MLDVLSYNEGSRKSIYFGFQLKFKKFLTRVVPARFISIISISIIIRDSPKRSINNNNNNYNNNNNDNNNKLLIIIIIIIIIL